MWVYDSKREINSLPKPPDFLSFRHVFLLRVVSNDTQIDTST